MSLQEQKSPWGYINQSRKKYLRRPLGGAAHRQQVAQALISCEQHVCFPAGACACSRLLTLHPSGGGPDMRDALMPLTCCVHVLKPPELKWSLLQAALCICHQADLTAIKYLQTKQLERDILQNQLIIHWQSSQKLFLFWCRGGGGGASIRVRTPVVFQKGTKEPDACSQCCLLTQVWLREAWNTRLIPTLRYTGSDLWYCTSVISVCEEIRLPCLHQSREWKLWSAAYATFVLFIFNAASYP